MGLFEAGTTNRLNAYPAESIQKIIGWIAPAHPWHHLNSPRRQQVYGQFPTVLLHTFG